MKIWRAYTTRPELEVTLHAGSAAELRDLVAIHSGDEEAPRSVDWQFQRVAIDTSKAAVVAMLNGEDPPLEIEEQYRVEVRDGALYELRPRKVR